MINWIDSLRRVRIQHKSEKHTYIREAETSLLSPLRGRRLRTHEQLLGFSVTDRYLRGVLIRCTAPIQFSVSLEMRLISYHMNADWGSGRYVAVGGEQTKYVFLFKIWAA